MESRGTAQGRVPTLGAASLESRVAACASSSSSSFRSASPSASRNSSARAAAEDQKGDTCGGGREGEIAWVAGE